MRRPIERPAAKLVQECLQPACIHKLSKIIIIIIAKVIVVVVKIQLKLQKKDKDKDKDEETNRAASAKLVQECLQPAYTNSPKSSSSSSSS